MMYFGGHMSGWGWIGATVGMVLFWGLLIVLAVAAYRALAGGGVRGGVGGGPGLERRGGAPAADPPRILAERFARGEIDEEEYRARLAVLDGAETAARTPR